MLVVLDASVALRVSLEQQGFTLLDEHELHAPALVLSEVLSAMHEAVWRSDLSRDLAVIGRERLLHAPLELVEDLAREAWTVADQLGWAKTYDAEYVALAARLDCPLVTLDQRLVRGAARAVTVMTPVDLAAAQG